MRLLDKLSPIRAPTTREHSATRGTVLAALALLLIAPLAPQAAGQLPSPGAPIGPVDAPPDMHVAVASVERADVRENTYRVFLNVTFECDAFRHYTGAYDTELTFEPSGPVEAVDPATQTVTADLGPTSCKLWSYRHQVPATIELDLAPEATAGTNISIPYVLEPVNGGEPAEGALAFDLPLLGEHSITVDLTYREKDGKVPIHLSVHNTYNAPLDVDVDLVGEPVHGRLSVTESGVIPPAREQAVGEDAGDLLTATYSIGDRGLDSFSIRIRAATLGPHGHPQEVLIEDVFEIRIDTEEGWIHARELEPIRSHATPLPGAAVALTLLASVAGIAGRAKRRAREGP